MFGTVAFTDPQRKNQNKNAFPLCSLNEIARVNGDLKEMFSYCRR
jgi:hypothetical protein